MDNRLVIPVEGSHFYGIDASPLYDVPNKSKPGEYRRATLRDAKSAGACPSVTTIGNVLDKPALTAWKISNAILAALTLPRIEGESDDDFARRVVEDADSPSRNAMDLGTTVHNAIEGYLAGHTIPADIMCKFVSPVDAWIKASGITIRELEASKVNRNLMYGCRVDAIGVDKDGMDVIIDWKTQKSPKGKLAAYDEHVMQLAANCMACLPNLSARLINVYVSTTTLDANNQALIMAHEWPEQDVNDGWEMFQHCRAIYKLKNGI
jgi:hypothetical protein